MLKEQLDSLQRGDYHNVHDGGVEAEAQWEEHSALVEPGEYRRETIHFCGPFSH